MKSSHPLLKWPRSDGDPNRWPTAQQRIVSQTEGWYELLPSGDKKWALYRGKVGEYLANHLKIPGNNSKQTMDMPEGYALFGHHKPQANNDIRTDVYLFGSVHAQKFRSTNEFFEHAVWLFDATKSIEDHTECGCKYNSISHIARAKRSSSSMAGPSKRANLSSLHSGKRQKIVEVEEESDEEEGVAGIVLERQIDLSSHRRFRKGELVWFRVPTLNPPETKGDTRNSDLPSITHWPGLVADIVAKTKMPAAASASFAAAWSIAGGVAPNSLRSLQRTTTTYEYHLRPLGMFSETDMLIRNADELLPWLVGNELLGGVKGWKLLGKDGTRVIEQGVVEEVTKGQDTFKAGHWKSSWGERVPFAALTSDWDTRVFRLGIALKTAAVITDAWTQTDKVDIVPKSDVNPEDLDAILDQRKTLYQGLFWGGERIWMEDMVRLKKSRSDLPSDALGEPSPGALDRSVLLRIRRVDARLESVNANLTRCISIEVSPDNLEEAVIAWRCLLYGDVFEVVAASDRPPTPVTADTSPGDLSKAYPYPRPKGFEYRQLNDPGSEVTVDILDIAGRLYPDLLDGARQNWFVDPDVSEKAIGGTDRVTAGSSPRALMGLRPGSLAGSSGAHWKEDLHVIVTEATKTVEKQMRRYYQLEVEKAKGAAGKQSTAAKPLSEPLTLNAAMAQSAITA